MKSKTLLPISLLILLFSISSCVEDSGTLIIKHYSDEEYEVMSKTLDIPQNPYSYQINFPEALWVNGQRSSFTDDDLATLGRVLFYDKNLSNDRSVSCASCHKPELGFSDDKALSDGIDGNVTTRNSLALGTTINFNVYYGSGEEVAFFLWDEQAKSINEQSDLALRSQKEMNMTPEEVEARVNSLDYYQPLIARVHRWSGTQELSYNDVTRALNEFVNSLTTSQSKFDTGLQLSPGFDHTLSFSNFTPQENLGKELFNENCGSCHGDKFNRVIRATANNGLDEEYTDQGVGNILGGHFNGIFKIPSIRNVALTGPYMHDGRFSTLEEVIDHYSEGIKAHINLDDSLKDVNGDPLKMNFDQEEKDALIAFLHTLTDLSVTTNPRFLDPFKN